MLPYFVHYHGVALVGDYLFVVGGSIYDEKKPNEFGKATNYVLVLDLHTMTWSRGASMNEK